MQSNRTLIPERLQPDDLKPGENKVRFVSKTIAGDLTLAGLLYLPDAFDAAAGPYPAIVLAGAFNQVKEQTCATYAAKLAKRGFIALCFDHRGYGESEGAIRNLEDAPSKIAGIQDAVSFLRMHAFVDRARVYGVGVCAGASHMAYAALTDRRLCRVAFVAGMLMNTMVHFTVNGTKKMDEILVRANEARQAFYETGEAKPFDALGFDDGTAKASAIVDQREGYDYYMTARAGAERFATYTHHTPEFFVEDNARYGARAIAPVLTTPAVTIYGAKASTRVFSLLFHFAKAGPKRLVRVEGATHVDLYDRDEFVDPAVDAIEAYFNSTSQGNAVTRLLNGASAIAAELAPVVLPLSVVGSVALAVWYRDGFSQRIARA